MKITIICKKYYKKIGARIEKYSGVLRYDGIDAGSIKKGESFEVSLSKKELQRRAFLEWTYANLHQYLV